VRNTLDQEALAETGRRFENARAPQCVDTDIDMACS